MPCQSRRSCAACGYGYYRTSTRTTNKKIYYYRCLGSDDYRYPGGRVCANKPVRADYLDTVVWDHITALLADPALIHAEIDKRLDQARTADPVTRERKRLEATLAKASTSITRMIEAFQEQLISIDELRARIPHLRAREANLRSQIDALHAQLADRQTYLKLTDDPESFPAQLRNNAVRPFVPVFSLEAAAGTWGRRRWVLRLCPRGTYVATVNLGGERGRGPLRPIETPPVDTACCTPIQEEMSTMKRSIHIEAPVEKVFDFVKDPRNVPEGVTVPFEIKDLKLTDEGVGSYYSWVMRIAGLSVEGFDVYTEFIPNQRITDRSSWSIIRDFIISFEPEGSGMKLTMETGHGSFWRFPPFRQLVDLVQSMISERFMSALKVQMEG